MKRIVRSAIVECAASEVFSLVDDIESYPEFVPWCLRATVHQRTGDHARATLEIGYRGLRHSITTENMNKPVESIDMRMLKGPFRKFSSGWRFRSLGELAANIEFHMEYEFASAALGRILDPLFDNLANTMVDVFSQRIAVVCGKNAR